MNVEQHRDLFQLGFFLVCTVMPLAIFLLARKSSRYSRCLYAFSSAFIASQVYDAVFGPALTRRLVEKYGQPASDTGGGAAIFLLGVILPILITFLALVIELIVVWIRSRKSAA